MMRRLGGWLLAMLGLAVSLARAEEPQVPTVDERIRQQAEDAPLRMRFAGGSAEECRAWQAKFAARLKQSLGEYAPPQTWKETLLRRVEHEDHLFEELLLTAEGHPPLPVCVLTPKGAAAGKRAGVLALHGHAPRGHLAIGEGESGRTLVRAGFVVVTPCFTPFGVRLGDPEAHGKQDPCGVTFIRLQLLGKLLIAENLRDSLWALELLARRAGVDANRLGCAGLSYGGRMTMLTTAVEPRIKVAVVSGALNVMQERIRGRYSCGAQVIPGLLEYGDVPEIAGLIAPRPAVWEVGAQDGLIDPEFAADALKRMEKVYSALGAADRLLVDRFDGGHSWSWRIGLPVLARELK